MVARLWRISQLAALITGFLYVIVGTGFSPEQITKKNTHRREKIMYWKKNCCSAPKGLAIVTQRITPRGQSLLARASLVRRHFHIPHGRSRPDERIPNSACNGILQTRPPAKGIRAGHCRSIRFDFQRRRTRRRSQLRILFRGQAFTDPSSKLGRGARTKCHLPAKQPRQWKQRGRAGRPYNCTTTSNRPLLIGRSKQWRRTGARPEQKTASRWRRLNAEQPRNHRSRGHASRRDHHHFELFWGWRKDKKRHTIQKALRSANGRPPTRAPAISQRRQVLLYTRALAGEARSASGSQYLYEGRRANSL